MIPSGWNKLKLNDICTTVTSGSRDWAKYYSDTGSKFIRMTNLQRDKIYLNLKDLKYVNVQSNSSDGKRTSLQAGDILMSITAELGKIGWVHEGLGEAYINQHTALIRLDSQKSNSQYIAYLLSSKYMNHRINRLNDSGAKAGLNLPTIRSIPLSIPDLTEQQKIAKILSTWDKAISTTEHLIDNSKQQKKALMQQLLTGKKRLLDDSGKPFEGEWAETKLHDLLEKIIDYRGQSVPKANHGIRLITARNIRKGYLDFTNQEYIKSEEFKAWMSRGIPQAGDILFTTEAPLGMACRFPSTGEYGVGQRTVTLRTNNKLNSDYLLHFLLSERGQYKIDLKSSGSTAKGIKSSELKKVKIFHPTSILEQKKLASILTDADKEIESLEQQLSNLKQEKKALMQQLLTGKRRVTVN